MSHLQVVREELDKRPEKRDATRAIRAAEECERMLSALRAGTTDNLILFMMDANREFVPTAAEVRKEIAEP